MKSERSQNCSCYTVVPFDYSLRRAFTR